MSSTVCRTSISLQRPCRIFPALDAQASPGNRVLRNRDRDGNGAATVAVLRETGASVFLCCGSDEDNARDAEEPVMFDDARPNDANKPEVAQRTPRQKAADRMSLLASDLNKDGTVTRDQSLAGADIWFAELDKNADGGITLHDFAIETELCI